MRQTYDPKDLYRVLGLSSSEANRDRVRAAYHRRAVAARPDQGEAPGEDVDDERWAYRDTMFRQLTVAYLILKDPELRRIYDSLGYDGVRVRGVPRGECL